MCNTAKTAASTTCRNDRTGQTVTLPLSHAEIAARFAEIATKDSWLWFHMANEVQHASASPKLVDMIGFISDLFVIAVGRGLKNPMIRLVVKETSRRYKIYLSARGTVCIKGGDVAPGTSDPVGDEEYIGCLLRGKFLPANEGYSNRPKPVAPKDQAFLDSLSADPVGFFAKCSKDMDRCCYCGQPLEDHRSKDVGYGSTCANRWGLPWGGKRTEEVPSFASLWQKATTDNRRDIRGICLGIRQAPQDDLGWAMLRDVLTDAGWPEERLPNKPDDIRKMPRE